MHLSMQYIRPLCDDTLFIAKMAMPRYDKGGGGSSCCFDVWWEKRGWGFGSHHLIWRN